MNHQSLKKFIDLITFDQDAIALEKKLEKSKQAIQEIQKKLAAEEQKKSQAEFKQQDLIKMVHQQELTLKDLEDQEKTLLKKIEKISASREYDAGVKELDQIRVQQTLEEQKYIQLTNKLEQAKKDLVTVVFQVQEQIKQYQDLIAQENHDIETCKAELVTVDQQRAEKLIGISSEWLDIYEMMKGRVTDPVVPMSQDSCSVCFYGLTPRDLQILKQNGLLQCKDCYRLLYEPSLL
jgi:predicted  nucleic acid-binding Zn-ribbon protein